ncbi:transcriptional regulator [Bifidobacterium margollesii]|uniref:Transcriptional regulator n=2 Tax=Bifidobacterium margollesii TaxID=2020964 RepID=A0A2N5J7L0_9BIFI|nr:transcriptional regulator [Bifidobacterium margollesii]
MIETTPRVRLRDIKPYRLPGSLDELRGPAHGRIRLRHAVRWAPGDGIVDLDEPGGVRMAYQALIAEGGETDQREGINAGLLVGSWPDLNLDPRVRRLWEERFPELAAVRHEQ